MFVTSVADRPNPVPPNSARDSNTADVSGTVGPALRTRVAAFWASWSDCLPMIRARHPIVAAEWVRQLEGVPASPTLHEAATARRELTGVAGFEPPTWREMAAGTRAPEREPEDFEPGWVRGWQHEASYRVHRSFREMDLCPRMNESPRALVRSQAGPGGGVALSTCPTCRFTLLEPQVFRVLLLRRLQLPLPLTVRNCRCGHFLDVVGHHRAACARAGVLSKRGFALESVTARVCREAETRHHAGQRSGFGSQIGRMHDDSKWLLMACHCTAEHSWQWMQPSLALSTGAAEVDGVALTAARRRKERRYPELVGPRARA